MATLLEATLIGLPIILMARDDPTAHFLAEAIVIFLVCLAVLLFLFVPKWLDKNKPAAKTRYIPSSDGVRSSTEMTTGTLHAPKSEASKEFSDRAFKWR